MRVNVIYIVIALLVVYAWKDWFKVLNSLILVMAVIEDEDMPKTIFGIQGLNMWNILLLRIFLAWVANRTSEALEQYYRFYKKPRFKT